MGLSSSKQPNTPQKPSQGKTVTKQIVYPLITFQQTNQSSDSAFAKIPTELLYDIANRLEEKDVLNLASTCKLLHCKLSEDSYWVKKLSELKEFPFDESCPKMKYWYFHVRNESITVIDKGTYEFMFKVCIFSHHLQIGKSQLMRVLCDEPFEEYYRTTIGLDFKMMTWSYKDTKCKVQFWDLDTSQHRTFVRVFFRGSSVILLLYSVADRNSFENMDRLFGEVPQHSNGRIILVATFSDVPAETRVVTHAEGTSLANKYNVDFVEVSCKTGSGLPLLKRAILECGMAYSKVNSENRNPVVCKVDKSSSDKLSLAPPRNQKIH